MNDLWDYPPGVWDYREATWTVDRDLAAYDVEAVDGSIGLVDHAATDDAGAYVVVDLRCAGRGSHRLIPAGAVAALDHRSRTIHLALTRDVVEVAPDYVDDQWNDDERGDDVREEHGRYYGKHLQH